MQSRARLGAVGNVAAMLAALALAAAAQRGEAQPTPSTAQRVECEASGPIGEAGKCRVDLDTYLGYRVFEQFCSGCHALDALGSSFAPSLIERVAAMDEERFVDLMERGYTGPDASMPAWGEHPYVSRYYAELWRYLSARASGALPAGEPALAQPSGQAP